jgi:integrase
MATGNETDKLSKLLDYDLERFPVAFDGDNVANNIAQKLVLIGPLLTLNEAAHLQSTLDNIKLVAKPTPTARKHTHPLNKYVDIAPLYCALSLDRRERIPKTIEPLITLGQSLALLESLRPTLSKDQHRSITHFLHQIPAQTAASPNIAAQFVPVITHLLDIPSIESCLARTIELLNFGEIDKARGLEYKLILKTLLVHLSAQPTGVETSSRKTKKQRFSPGKKIHKPLSYPGGTWQQNPSKLPEDDTEDLEPTLTETEVDDEEDVTKSATAQGHQTEENARVFNAHGHRIRLNRLFAGRNTEAFSEAESYLAMRELVKVVPESHAQAAARLLFILCGLLGRRFDDLGKVIMGIVTPADETDGEIIAVHRSGNLFTIEVRHILAWYIPELPEKLLKTKCRLSFTLNVATPSLPDLDIAWRYLTICPESLLDDRVSQLLKEKKVLNDQFRKVALSRFNEKRLRGGIMQAVFSHDYDLPKTQLIFSEAFEASLAALHYTSWQENVLQNALNQANASLYKNLLPTQPNGTTDRVGADKSQIKLSTLAASVKWFNATQRKLRKLGHPRWRERHSLLVDSTSHIFGVGAAHRFTKDLANLTINDLCLSFGLAIFRDKPAESSMYRRIAILPTPVIDMLKRFITHLEFLRDADSDLVPLEVRDLATQTLLGEIPLFWHLDGTQTTRPNPRKHFNSFLENNQVEPNFCRHLYSTSLREIGASPLLIELHLGHHVRDPVLGKDGLISPRELADTIRPFLNALLESFGYSVPASSSSTFVRHPYNKKELSRLHETEIKADRSLLAKQLGKAVTQLGAPKRRKIIDEAIRLEVPKFDGKALPPNTKISKEQALNIRRNLVNVIGNDFTAIYRVCRQLRKKLRILTEVPGCTVEIPPPISWNIRPPLPITPAHFVAADQYSHLEQRLLEYCETESCNRMLIAKSALILWSHCSSYKEAAIWLDGLRTTPLIKGADFQVIDVPNGESRTIGGIAYILCLAWLRHGATDTEGSVSSIFGRGFNQETIEATVAYAHWIRYSGVIARALSGKLPHQELPRKRLLAFLYDQPTTRIQEISDFYRTSRTPVAPGARRKPDECERLFKTLRQQIPSPNGRGKKNGKDSLLKTAPTKAIATWRQHRDLPSLINLFAHWAEVLLGPHANQTTKRKLHYDTVRKYLRAAWVPLFALFPDGNIEDLDADEMTDLLLDAINQYDSSSLLGSDNSAALEDESSGISQAKSINRFFQEMGEIYVLPSVVLPVSESSQPQIDANVFTESETSTIINTLTSWSKDPQAETSLAAGLSQLVDATQIFSMHGLRRNELLFSRNRDFVHTDTEVVLLVRWHPDRTIKTLAGIRHFPLELASAFSSGDKRTKHHYDMLVNTGVMNLLSDALSVVLRHTTQDEGARLNRFRHTVANKGVAEALASTDVIAKLRRLTTVSADMGHAHVAITLLYYTHTLHFTLAKEDAISQPSLSNKTLSHLFCQSTAAIRKKYERSSKDNIPVAASLAHSLPMVTPILKSKRQDLPPLIDTLRPKSQEAISLQASMTWILRTARNQDPLFAATGLGFSVETLASLANALIRTQRQLKWAAIEESRLWNLAGELTGPNTAFNEVTVHHKRFPGPNIDRLIKKIPANIEHISTQFPLHLLGINMTQSSVVTDKMQSQYIRDCLSACRIPITITPIAGSSNLVSLVVDTGEPDRKHDANITRLLITGLIAYFHHALA